MRVGKKINTLIGAADEYKGSITYSDDTATTNIYLGNINPQVRSIYIPLKHRLHE